MEWAGRRKLKEKLVKGCVFDGVRFCKSKLWEIKHHEFESIIVGGNSGVVHPSTGYMLARTMALAPVVAASIYECLGSTSMIRGKDIYADVWNSMWPIESRVGREFYTFGMETLLKLDLNETRDFLMH
ncbi:unnamed protein product [Vicia faba]|uniref:Uncharacterized protein n=1 Tax=Vicia faba TaxID=3906 RepID=A0AAV0Z2V5_VICFA|nr:unnamed protein product [Vicia faba]